LAKQQSKSSFIREHSLSLAAAAIVIALIVLYSVSSPSTHLGSFFGNAIADWTGVVVTVLATKFMYEKGSAESRQPPMRWLGPIRDFLRDHSLSIFLLITGAAWVTLFVAMDSESKWGQVVGNIVSEWTQIFGLVLLTKKLIEKHSKEGSR
jgi:peptidoglycan/LPS O-acetylase OafA/YrhL